MIIQYNTYTHSVNCFKNHHFNKDRNTDGRFNEFLEVQLQPILSKVVYIILKFNMSFLGFVLPMRSV